MQYGGFSLTRRLDAPRERAYAAWTELEHRRHWFAGPAWTEVERSLDLRPGGTEVAHGRFENGPNVIYTARFHLIEPNRRLIYAFDMHVGGVLFSVSLAGVDFADLAHGTELTYSEQGLFLIGDYDAAARAAGTEGLLDKFAAYVQSMR